MEITNELNEIIKNYNFIPPEYDNNENVTRERQLELLSKYGRVDYQALENMIEIDKMQFNI